MARKPMVAGNWKMNGNKAFVSEITAALNKLESTHVDRVVCPPACFLPLFEQPLFSLAGQDVSQHDNGAHTGDLSVQILADFACDYVIVGHSERREDHGESSELVAQKAKKALSGGLQPIVCVGEPLSVRESGDVEAYVSAQLQPVLALLSEQELAQCVIAYEPVWAIGTGKTASPQQAQDVHAFIRQCIARKYESVAVGIRILYGGSVKPDNAQELFAQVDIDGGLIGGASLKVESFVAICEAAE